MTPSNLFYIPLNGKDEIKSQSILLKKQDGKTHLSAVNLGENAWENLIALITYYQNPQQGYLSHAVPMSKRYEGDYDHLARLWEWSSGFHKEE